MTWFKVDDSFFDHPKVLAIPERTRDRVLMKWWRAGCWSAKHLTDGVIEAHIARQLRISHATCAQLVAVGLWEVCENGWKFHDWDDYQPTRDQVMAKRAATKERVSKWRDKKGFRVLDGGG